MKVFCFLITLIFVNCSERDEARYKEAVFITNVAIELAYNKNDLTLRDRSGANGLEHVIEKMVNDEAYNCFAKINLMIAVPEKTDLINHIPVLGLSYYHPVIRRKQYQIFMLNEIRSTLEIDIPEVDEDQDFVNLDLTTLADQRRCLVKPALKNIFRRVLGSIYYQLLVKLERGEKLGLNLTTLVEERRVSGTSLENIIRRRVFDGPVSDVSIFTLCRLIGLYMSTQFPTTYIKEVSINYDDNTCTLDDGITKKRFKRIDGEWWEISVDGTVLLLEEQLI